jgi:hypothetical protein
MAEHLVNKVHSQEFLHRNPTMNSPRVELFFQKIIQKEIWRLNQITTQKTCSFSSKQFQNPKVLTDD